MSLNNLRTRLYALNIEEISEKDYQNLYELVPLERKNKADRIRRFKDKLRCICAYLMLEQIYWELVKQFPENINNKLPYIKAGPKGKPFFENSPIHFNISHCKDRILCAISLYDVGCDVENKDNNSLKIAERFFTKEEYDYVYRNGNFTKIWTLKESVIKAIGDGLSFPMNDFNVVVDDEIAKSIQIKDEKGVYYLKNYPKDGEYEMSICGKSNDFEDSVFDITEKFMNNYISI